MSTAELPVPPVPLAEPRSTTAGPPSTAAADPRQALLQQDLPSATGLPSAPPDSPAHQEPRLPPVAVPRAPRCARRAPAPTARPTLRLAKAVSHAQAPNMCVRNLPTADLHPAAIPSTAATTATTAAVPAEAPRAAITAVPPQGAAAAATEAPLPPQEAAAAAIEAPLPPQEAAVAATAVPLPQEAAAAATAVVEEAVAAAAEDDKTFFNH